MAGCSGAQLRTLAVGMAGQDRCADDPGSNIGAFSTHLKGGLIVSKWQGWFLMVVMLTLATERALAGDVWWTMFDAFLAGGLFMGAALDARGRLRDTQHKEPS